MIKHEGKTPTGYKGGRIFENADGLLPLGRNYREYDILPYTKGFDRGGQRIVVDIAGKRAWYTPDHYRTFTEMSW